MANIIDIDSRELVKFTNKLESIGKYEVPVVVRQTLNELAFQMKGYSGREGMISKEAKTQFEHSRNKTLFKAFTGVQKSKGNNINSMSSRAGIIQRSGRERLAEGLADHGKPGPIKSNVTPMSKSRVGNVIGRNVRKKYYLNKLVPVDLSKNKGKRFNVRAYQAYKNDRAIMFTGRTGDRFVAEITKINRGDGHKYRYKMDVLFRINKSRIIKYTKEDYFLTIARDKMMLKGDNIFVEKANNRIKRKFEKK